MSGEVFFFLAVQSVIGTSDIFQLSVSSEVTDTQHHDNQETVLTVYTYLHLKVNHLTCFYKQRNLSYDH